MKYVDVPVYKDKIVYLDKFVEVEVEKVVEKIKEVPLTPSLSTLALCV